MKRIYKSLMTGLLLVAGSILPLQAQVSIFLTDNMFKGWDGVGADAVSLSSEIPEMNIGSEIGGGVTVYGNPVVDPLAYADLTGYEKIVFEGTPEIQLRVLMNRELGGEYGSFNGAYIEENPVIGEDGKAEVDLTSYSYVHLNAIKTGWESPIGIITAIKLINQEEDAPYNPDEGGENPDKPNEGEFNPTNPADPHMNYKVKTSVEPQAAGAWINVWDENWDGHYRYGEQITLECPATNGSYCFTHWTMNGVQYSTDPYITYTMGSSSVKFVAHYEFKPEDPNDPSYTASNRLYLKADPITACTFNQPSGQKWSYETTIYLSASPNSGYKFEGWYYKGNLYSKSLDFSFQMPDEEVTLVARFEYNPENPGDPFGDGSQSNVENKPKGDANRDGEVDVADAVRIINLCLANEKEAEADVNGDGEVDVADAVAVINLCLKNK